MRPAALLAALALAAAEEPRAPAPPEVLRVPAEPAPLRGLIGAACGAGCPAGSTCTAQGCVQQWQPAAQVAGSGQAQTAGAGSFFDDNNGKIMAFIGLLVIICVCCVLPCFCMKELYECFLGPGSFGDPSGNGYNGTEMAAAMAAAGAAGYYMGDKPQGGGMYPQY